MNAFNEIAHSREYTQVGPLALTTGHIKDHCEYYYIYDLQQRTTLAKYVRALDNEYLERIFQKAEDDKTANNSLPTNAP